MMPKFLKDMKGFSLVEILISAAVLGISVSALSTFLVKTNQGLTHQQRVAGLNAIYEQLRSTASSPSSLAISAQKGKPGNTPLINCVNPVKNCATNSTNSRKQLTFNLFSADGQKIAGKANAPQGYDWDGKKCEASEPKCLWGAIAYFWATCPPPNPTTQKPAATCTVPTKVNMRFQIVPFAGAQPKKGSKFYEYPRNRDFKGKDKYTSYAISIQNKDIIDLIQDECAADQKQTGVNPDGKPICECVVKATTAKGKFKKDGFGRPVCGPQQCKSKFEIMTGYDGDTGRITCLDLRNCPSDKNCPCKTIDLNKSGDCGPGYWMVNMNQGKCEVDNSKSSTKGGPKKVSCSGRTAQCCKLDFE